MTDKNLTVTIITLNEEKNIKTCLESVKGIADEIIIVDSGSSDKTVEIAKKYGAKTFIRKFDNYANQKNFAVSKSGCEWILSMDADEQIESELADEIVSNIEKQKTINTLRQAQGRLLRQSSGQDNQVTSTQGVKSLNGSGNIQNTTYDTLPVAYSIPRKNIIFGKFIRYTRWQPELDRHIWLWMKNYGKWVGDVHEEVVVNGDVGKLKGAKIHNQYETVREFLDMVNSYSEFEAGQKVKEGKKFSYSRIFFDPIYNFLVRYFYRLGFLDGWRGFILSYLMGIYHLMVWVKVWEKRKNKLT